MNTGNSTCNQEREYEIRIEMDRGHYAVNSLAGIVGEMESRLKAITIPYIGDVNEQKKDTAQPVAPLAGEIFKMVKVVEAQTERLRSLIERLEIEPFRIKPSVATQLGKNI